jgi:hypothetical protein
MKKVKTKFVVMSVLIIQLLLIITLLIKLDNFSFEKNLLFNKLIIYSKIETGMNKVMIEERLGKPDSTVFVERGNKGSKKFAYFFDKIPTDIIKIIICRYYWGLLKQSENYFIYYDNADESKLIYFAELL